MDPDRGETIAHYNGWSRQPPATLEEWLKPVVIANQLQQRAML